MTESMRPCQMGESSARKDCGQISPITDFEIEDGVLKEYLGDSETVVIPEGVITDIGSDAFGYCGFLKSIHIPDGVTSIGEFAFSWCESLESIHIPNSVTSIRDLAFYKCRSLPSIHITEGVTRFCDCALEG